MYIGYIRAEAGKCLQLSCSKQVKLQQVLSSWVLSISEDGESTVSLGSLCHCLTILTVEKKNVVGGLYIVFGFYSFFFPFPVQVEFPGIQSVLIVQQWVALRKALLHPGSNFFFS